MPTPCVLASDAQSSPSPSPRSRPRLLALTPLRIERAAVRRGAPNARVVATGMGRRRSVRAAARLRAEAADGGAVAIVGFAGALTPEVRAGDLVVASAVRGPDDAVRELPCAPLVAGALRRAGLRVHVGPVASSEHLVRGTERTRLGAAGALAVDMESAWLAEVTDGPLCVVRAVVDTPAAGLASPSTPHAGIAAYRALVAAAGVLDASAAAVLPAGQVRQVVRASPRSFCAGVERAIATVEQALGRFGSPVYVRRQIVHNRHVVADLEAKGAVFVEELEEVPTGATVVFSAHGVAPAVHQDAARRALNVIDATCPLVAKVHKEARRFVGQGYQVVLIGHAGHDEIEGTLGEVPHGAISLLERPEEVADLEVPDPGRVAYLSQTTLATDEVVDVVDSLRARFPALAGPAASDICYASQNRQEAVRAVAASCDLLLVVGSRNSSNSNRLVEVAERQGCRAQLIDDAGDLDPAWLADTATVGVTAGASAPESMVSDVVAALAALGPIEVIDRSLSTETVQFPLPLEVR